MKCIAFGCVNKDSDGLFAGQLCMPCFWKLTDGKGEYGTSVLFTSQARIRELEAREATWNMRHERETAIADKATARVKELEAALRKVETFMMIVEPRSHKAEYINMLASVRCVLPPYAPQTETSAKEKEITMNNRPAENYGLDGLPTEVEYLRADRKWLADRIRELEAVLKSHTNFHCTCGFTGVHVMPQSEPPTITITTIGGGYNNAGGGGGGSSLETPAGKVVDGGVEFHEQPETSCGVVGHQTIGTCPCCGNVITYEGQPDPYALNRSSVK